MKKEKVFLNSFNDIKKNIKNSNFLLLRIFSKIYKIICDIYFDNKNKKIAGKIRKTYNLDQKSFIKSKNDFYEFAIVAIFKNEDPYLVEWIEFHRIVGVEHFFLYDNGNSETSRKILKPYIDTGLVTYIPFPNLDIKGMRDHYSRQQFSRLSIQNLAYGDCVINYKHNFRWLIKIDIDEFLYPLSPYKNLRDVFKNINEKSVKGLYLRSLRFGPSGHKMIPDLPVIDSYKYRYEKNDKNWKSVGNSKYISTNKKFFGCHFFFYNFSIFKKVLDDDVTSKYLCLNHYYIKSKDEYENKIRLNENGYLKGKENLDKWFKINDEASFKDEGEILKYSSELKKQLGNYYKTGKS